LAGTILADHPKKYDSMIITICSYMLIFFSI